MSIPNRNINYPTAIKYGAGRIKELADHCRANGINRPLFVTDPGLAAMPMVTDIVADVRKAGLGIGVFSDVRPNPVEANIDAGVKAFQAGRHDGVVAFGGGSGLDTGKAIASFQSALTLSANDADLYADLARAQAMEDDWPSVESDLNAALNAMPANAKSAAEILSAIDAKARVDGAEEVHMKLAPDLDRKSVV